MTVAAILTAAGSGTRLGHPLPKALVPLRGERLLLHAARGLLAARTTAGERVEVLVVTTPADRVDEVAALLAGVLGEADVRVEVVLGGATRQASVAAAIAVLPHDVDVVLVHDAARPLAPPSLAARVVEAVRAGHAAVVPGLPVVDTVKRVGPADGSGAERVRETVARTDLRAVQTPQGFERALLVEAHTAGADHGRDERTAVSDDAGLVERLGRPVWVVRGDDRAAKITTARDLALAELLLAEEDA
ncbi:2-C-methyl-D-erythritol 4-phosphate cytidylyltransferase [Cellulomonas alba]|uniref:2-C-methyl-D-erythritol 4-phosphate cytidylyltransferase n=1 Tax=Cellulomonas alba TaxID=3053467 RepID=A0ABT7SGX1_9CELL|nr:2-C-methyl-D-erythritol 4-phosphate cytidylyltransferase [Cellulomonas alba]MDM7855391.1 2-C-methyl-D-erythritol 4-phosphate cytidylyltransferase [Cellulomonas alba]